MPGRLDTAAWQGIGFIVGTGGVSEWEDISLAPLNDERLVYPELESGESESGVASLLVVSVWVTEATGVVWAGATGLVDIDGGSWWVTKMKSSAVYWPAGFCLTTCRAWGMLGSKLLFDHAGCP